MAAGLQRTVVSGAPGSVLVIYPGLSFYWPDTRLTLFNLYCLASRVLLELGAVEPVETRQMTALLLSGLALLLYLSHILLSCAGV